MRRFAALLLALAVLVAGLPAFAGIGTPAQLGQSGIAAGTAAFTITTSTNDCPVGATAVVTYSSSLAGVGLSSVSDNAAVPNTWTVLDAGGASIGQAAVAYAPITSDLAIGKIITVTGSSTTAIKAGNAFCVSGLTSTPADTHNHTSTGSALSATTVSTGTLAQATELIVAVLGTGGGATSAYTPGGSFASVGGGCQTSVCIWQSWQIVSSTASVSATPSWTFSTSYTSNIVSFLGVAPVGGASAGMLGVGQ